MLEIASTLVHKHLLTNSFYIASMNTLKNKIQQWRAELPMIDPFYAVKCNPDKEMIKTMINNKFGFDCASKKEIDTILGLGGTVNKIIYAHPVKRVEDLIYASQKGIKYTTFDSLSELHKLHENAPRMKCIIRLKVDNPTARVQLGLKYGAEKDEYQFLIDEAKNLNIDIVGTSFHVGSFSKDPQVFSTAIDYSREVFDYARKKGFLPYLLDVGGGFTKETFKDCARVLRESIDDKFGAEKDKMSIVAEPGRFFAEEVFEFFVPVIGQRKRKEKYEYWVNDGLYGSFNCIIYDGQEPTYEVFRNPLLPKYDDAGSPKSPEYHDSVLWANTCDSADCLSKSIELPYLRNGDFLRVKNFGAYTIAGSCDFNGINMTKPTVFYV